MERCAESLFKWKANTLEVDVSFVPVLTCWAARCSVSHACSSVALMVWSAAFLTTTSVQLENCKWSPRGVLARCNPPFPLCCVRHWLKSLSFSAKGRHPQHGLSRALLVFTVPNVTRSKATRHWLCCWFPCAERREGQSSQTCSMHSGNSLWWRVMRWTGNLLSYSRGPQI